MALILSSGEHVLELTALLKRRKNGVGRRELEFRWNCSPSTVHRVVKSAREKLAARFAEKEQWHPKQRLRILADGKVRLEFPCGDIRELVRDVMRYADEVEVEGPEELRTAFAEMVRRAASRRYFPK